MITEFRFGSHSLMYSNAKHYIESKNSMDIIAAEKPDCVSAKQYKY